MRIVGGLAAVSLLLFGGAVPAQAQDGCTTDLVRKLVTAEDEDSPYPIVERDPDGTVHVYPQNVVPGTVYTVNNALEAAGQTVGHVLAWVDCVG